MRSATPRAEKRLDRRPPRSSSIRTRRNPSAARVTGVSVPGGAKRSNRNRLTVPDLGPKRTLLRQATASERERSIVIANVTQTRLPFRQSPDPVAPPAGRRRAEPDAREPAAPPADGQSPRAAVDVPTLGTASSDPASQVASARGVSMRGPRPSGADPARVASPRARLHAGAPPSSAPFHLAPGRPSRLFWPPAGPGSRVEAHDHVEEARHAQDPRRDGRDPLAPPGRRAGPGRARHARERREGVGRGDSPVDRADRDRARLRGRSERRAERAVAPVPPADLHSVGELRDGVAPRRPRAHPGPRTRPAAAASSRSGASSGSSSA
jgi:hypothetical protein